MLLGEPSPALTKIARMNTEKLQAHIETMLTESDRLRIKIENLSNMTPVDEKRVETLELQVKRLDALMEAAKERLDGKIQRSQGYANRGYSRRRD